MANRDFLGVGIKYPFEIDEFGSIRTASRLDLIQQSIVRILETKKGSQLFNRDFGSYIRELLYEPNDAILFSLLDFHVSEAIQEWEKRVEGVNTNIEINSKEPSRVDIRIQYTIVASNVVDSFIFPFYRELID